MLYTFTYRLKINLIFYLMPPSLLQSTSTGSNLYVPNVSTKEDPIMPLRYKPRTLVHNQLLGILGPEWTRFIAYAHPYKDHNEF